MDQQKFKKAKKLKSQIRHQIEITKMIDTVINDDTYIEVTAEGGNCNIDITFLENKEISNVLNIQTSFREYLRSQKLTLKASIKSLEAEFEAL